MNTVTENINTEEKASDTPEVKANDAPEAKATDKEEAKIEGDNVSCCGSCSD